MDAGANILFPVREFSKAILQKIHKEIYGDIENVMSKRTVIVSGGMVEKDFALSILKSEETEFVIGVDRGLVFLYDNEIKPDYIVGRF